MHTNLYKLTSLLNLIFIPLIITFSLFFFTFTAHSKPLSSQELNERGARLAQNADFLEAEKALQQAVKLDEGNLTAVFNLSSVYIQRKKLNQAISLLEKYTKNYKKDAGLFARLGDAYFAKKDIENAAKNYEATLKKDPNFPKISSRLGTIYVMTKKPKKAVEMYEKAISQQPNNTDYLRNLSNLYLGLGETDKAIKTAQTAISISSTPDLYTVLGGAYERKSEWERALNAYQSAKKAGASSKQLDTVIKRVENQLASTVNAK